MHRVNMNEYLPVHVEALTGKNIVASELHHFMNASVTGR